MGVKVITPATQQLTVAELRLNSRADPLDTTEDPLFVRWLARAVALAEHYTERSIGSQTLELALDDFPSGPIELLRGPVTSIVSIIYTNISGVDQTLSPTLYSVDNYSRRAWALPKFGTEWPVAEGSANCVKVRYIAGDLDPAVMGALFLAVSFWYENREASDKDVMNGGFASLLNTVKAWRI